MRESKLLIIMMKKTKKTDKASKVHPSKDMLHLKRPWIFSAKVRRYMERNLLIVISWKHVVSESSFNQRKQGQISIKHVEENGLHLWGY